MDIRNQMFRDLHIHANVIYVLKNDSDEIRALACDSDEPFRMFGVTGRMNRELFINTIPDWDFNVDTYLFEDMEQGFDIAYMPILEHYDVWCAIKSLEGEIDHQAGLQNYLKYCQMHDITPEAIKALGMIDNLNVMNLYKETNEGYRIISEYNINRVTYVIGHHPKAPEPFVVWRTTINRAGGYDIGHYFTDYDEAFKDFKERINDEVDKQVYLKRKCFKKERNGNEAR